MEILWFILVLLASYFFMEFVAWFAHKYVMHGFGWFTTADRCSHWDHSLRGHLFHDS
jgi:beta-carotene 3-hydroxylase